MCVAHQELTMASLLLLGFHCLLRTGKVLQLRPIDFIKLECYQYLAVRVEFATIRKRV